MNGSPILVKIISHNLAEVAGVMVESIQEAWPIPELLAWTDDDGRQYAYEVWVYDDVEDGDPPVGWLAYAEDVELLVCADCGESADASLTKSGITIWKCFRCTGDTLRKIVNDEFGNALN